MTPDSKTPKQINRNILKGLTKKLVNARKFMPKLGGTNENTPSNKNQNDFT